MKSHVGQIGVLFSWRDNSSNSINTLGPLCLVLATFILQQTTHSNNFQLLLALASLLLVSQLPLSRAAPLPAPAPAPLPAPAALPAPFVPPFNLLIRLLGGLGGGAAQGQGSEDDYDGDDEYYDDGDYDEEEYDDYY